MTLARRTREIALLAIVYALAGRLGLQMDAVSGFATLVWPPTGIALAALLLRGSGLWPGVFVGAFVVNSWTGAPWLVACGIAAGNTLEALVGAWALRRVGISTALGRLGDVAKLVLLGAALSTMVSATVGVSSLFLGNIIDGERVGATWRAWWVGDAIGALVMSAPLLTWFSSGAGTPSKSWIEAAVLAVAETCACLFVFGVLPIGEAPLQQPYMLFPILVWGAVRFGPRGATASTLLTSIVAIVTTWLQLGPFVRETLHASLLSLQVFIAFIAITLLVVGAIASELTLRRAELYTALESMRVAREQAEQANQFKSRLLRTVSHELRTPLATLWLQLERLRVESEELSDDVELLERMVVQMTRMRDMIESLLQYARLESRGLTLQLEDVDLTRLASECLDERRAQAKLKGLELHLDARHARQECLGDPRVLHVILSNLIGNAIKFTSQGSVTVTLDRNATHHVIEVTDTGPGIAAEDQARIFDAFEQLEPAREKRTAGVGLGLALVRDLTTSLGGSIAVQSALGCGSTFSVLMPASPPERETAQPPPPISSSGSGGSLFSQHVRQK